MKTFLHVSKAVCLMWLTAFGAVAQPFEIGNTTITFTDPSRGNREIETEIYYPAISSGEDAAIATTFGGFPVAAFGHGFVMSYTAYQNINEMMVPNGYVVAYPKTETGILPSHASFGLDLAFVISQIELLGNTESSIFYQRLNGKSAVMGHSMGGGAAFLAANGNLEIDAIVTLAPAETNPSAIGAASNIQIPALVIAGANDCVTPPDENQFPMYNALQSSCKTYISINGASHCQMANYNLLCSIGEGTCSPSADISREQQHGIISTYLISWLNAQLKEDCESGTSFNDQIESSTAITFERSCEQCELLAVTENHKNFKMYPNPVKNTFVIEVSSGNYVLELHDMQSRLVLRDQLSGNTQINIENHRTGLYIATISENGATVSVNKLLKE